MQELINHISKLIESSEQVIVAIDGMAAAGKSSLAAMLNDIFSCNVISTDSFFLRPEQRTPERLSQPGGNIDYERFFDEVIEPLKLSEPFSYRPYDCRTQELTPPVAVKPNHLTVIEGVYSMHPRLAYGVDDKTYDTLIYPYSFSIFMCLEAEEQRSRISERSPMQYERFINEWIPMENQYFEYYRIPEKCDMIMST